MRINKAFLLSFFCVITSLDVLSQSAVTSGSIGVDSSEVVQPVDSLGKVELAPTDIEADRGLYIQTDDKEMQLRILGSIRLSVLYDFVNTSYKKTFNSFYIPIGESRVEVPNYYSDLAQSRFGFEVLRKLKEQDLFIRLEMDFNGGLDNKFRIRHAYGKYNKILVGQTWSLFTDLKAIPITVSPDGPTGSVILRTPQIRYYNSNKRGLLWAVALEYSRPDLNQNNFDSSGVSVVQYIPDLTARIEKETEFGHIQLATVVNTLSVLDEVDEINNFTGFGGLLTGTYNLDRGQILYQITYGRSISQFITNLNGTGNDASVNIETREIEPLQAFAGYLGYDFKWTDEISSNIVAGYSSLDTQSYDPDDAYKESYSIAFNNFWRIVDGARLGLEYMYAERINKNKNSGGASRVSLLFYYDF